MTLNPLRDKASNSVQRFCPTVAPTTQTVAREARGNAAHEGDLRRQACTSTSIFKGHLKSLSALARPRIFREATRSLAREHTRQSAGPEACWHRAWCARRHVTRTSESALGSLKKSLTVSPAEMVFRSRGSHLCLSYCLNAQGTLQSRL